MSILLEALKKSEQQRQLGETPTINTPVEAVGEGGDSLQHWIPLSLVVLSVAVMAWFGWQQFRVPEGESAEPESATRTAQVAEGEHSTPTQPPRSLSTADPQDRVAVEPPSAERGRTPIESFQAPPKAPASAKVVPRPVEAEQSGDLEQFDLPSDRVAVETAPRKGRSNSAAPSRDEGVPAREDAPVENARVPAHESEPISYWELPQGIRDSLPELRITVLVYAEQPEDRFLLMNGQRLAEKEEMDDGLMLEEIRREGAVFQYRKYRFMVKG